MKITMSPSSYSSGLDAFACKALRDWYDSQPHVRRLWVIRSEGAPGPGALRVIVMLEPSPDGDDPSPRWMADGARWALELCRELALAVELERIDGPLPEAFEIDGDGVLLSALGWRDATLLQD